MEAAGPAPAWRRTYVSGHGLCRPAWPPLPQP